MRTSLCEQADQGMAAALEDYQQLATEITNVQQQIDRLDVVQQKLYGNLDFDAVGVMDREVIVRYTKN